MWALTEDGFIMAMIFDEDLAHEIASEYDFDIDYVEQENEVAH